MTEKLETVEPKEEEVAESTKVEEVTEPTKDDENTLLTLSKDELANIIKETRGEAKTRRLKQRELEEKIAEIEKSEKSKAEQELKEKNEFKTLYENTLEEYKDYGEIKKFKEDFLNGCKEQVEKSIPKLTKPEQEIFDLSAKNLGYDKQIVLINKIMEGRSASEKTKIDKTQSTIRSSEVGSQASDHGNVLPFQNSSGVFGKILNSLKKKSNKEN